MGKRLHKHGWGRRHLLLSLVMLAFGVCAMWLDWAHIASIVRKDPEASHIILTPLVVGWLVWVRRARFRTCTPRAQWIGPLFILVGWGMSAWGFRDSIQSFRHAGAVLAAVGCILTIVGKDILMRFLPAFVALIFLVPLPERIRQPVAQELQLRTAQVTKGIFDVAGIEVGREGSKLRINGQEVAIAEACNGMRLVFTLALVSYAFAFGEPLKHYVRFAIVLLSPVSAIACNVIRMVPTVWVYGYYSKPFADDFHEAAGWAMLVVAFALLMGIIRLLRWAMLPVQHYTLASQ